MPVASRRQGQRGFARRGATTRPPPGAALIPPREQPDFQRWNGEYGPGTYPEYVVFRWLEKQGYRHGLDFTYQVPFGGGRLVYGAQVTDFIVNEWLAWPVNGLYWHYRRDPDQRERDAANYARLQDLGYTVVVLLDVDVIERTDPTLRMALNGIEVAGAREGARSV